MTLEDEMIALGLPLLKYVDENNWQFTRDLTPEEEKKFFALLHPNQAVHFNSYISAKNIPNWATWNEQQALDWVQTNIGTPLADGRNQLPVNITLTNIRPILVGFLSILDKMLILLIALTRMVVALRDNAWNGKL
jgi:hypothetical protein